MDSAARKLATLGIPSPTHVDMPVSARRVEHVLYARYCADHLDACLATGSRYRDIYRPRIIRWTVGHLSGPWVDPHGVGRQARRFRSARTLPAGQRIAYVAYADAIVLPLP